MVPKLTLAYLLLSGLLGYLSSSNLLLSISSSVTLNLLLTSSLGSSLFTSLELGNHLLLLVLSVVDSVQDSLLLLTQHNLGQVLLLLNLSLLSLGLLDFQIFNFESFLLSIWLEFFFIARSLVSNWLFNNFIIFSITGLLIFTSNVNLFSIGNWSSVFLSELISTVFT